ncbi:MAG: hypothetical protein HY023_10485 [Chloroflexi bacterium]|nr:hypothetical protein [Chloroflexota bacterium]
MRQFTARIVRLNALANGHVLAAVAGPLPGGHAAGQFYLALPAERNQSARHYLRLPLFLESFGPDGMTIELPPDLTYLSPGDELDLIGPCGRGLILPERARNVLLIAGPAGPARLRPIADSALARRASIVLYSETPQSLDGLSPEIEARFGPAHLSEAVGWADAIYADLERSALSDLQRRLRDGAANGEWPTLPLAFALLKPPMPCGVGACLACAVFTSHGWKLACADGPFFDLLDLEL